MKRLEHLRNGIAQPSWNGDLERKEESLEAEKKQWGEQVAFLQRKLTEFTQTGNDFVTRALGT